MREAQEMVRAFMLKAGQLAPDKPIKPELAVQELRLRLHEEEAVCELADAFAGGTLADVADSIADSLVVVLGTAVACGIDIEPIFLEVMRSNMTKFIDGHRRADGKWMKGPSYTPPNIEPILRVQADSQP